MPGAGAVLENRCRTASERGNFSVVDRAIHARIVQMGTARVVNRPSAVSIVIATRNRCRQVLSTLERLVTLPERPPVIVVDNASCDPTVAAVPSSFPDVRLVPLERNHGAAARNFGVDAAATPYVAFSDDDSWWAEGALGLAEDALRQSPKLGLIAARILVGPEQRLDPTCARMAAGPANENLPGRAVSGFVACGAVVRRDAYLDARGFHPRYGTGGEERLLAIDLLRLGWGLAFISDVVCHHHPRHGGDRTG